MAGNINFTDGEMAVDKALGFPKAYAKLWKDPSVSPPFTFIPFPQEVSRAKEFEEMFPIVDPNAKPSIKPKIFVTLLWKQLDHLGNAGFDPDMFRIDPYGNVLYFHADSASPLAWDIDHWFPCSRGGLTVPRNLRILQWQVCEKKHNKLEFLIPWWDLQVGISINQFLSIFASSNLDFRHRAFSWLFSEGESEELNTKQTVDSHNFPQHFIESKNKIGLAPAAVVLKSLDINRRPRSCTPMIASKKLKENEDLVMGSNPYEAIMIARDSLRQWDETAKIQADIQKLDDEERKLKMKAEEKKLGIEDLELVLMKKKRRVEKCRRLAEAQSSYKAMLEKMIRDAMHQSVVYKEQLRLNMAASNALMARLEAQRAICNSAEKKLHCKYKQRDELEKQIRPECEQTRKRSRVNDFLVDENTFYLPGRSELFANEEKEGINGVHVEELEERREAAVVVEDEKLEELEKAVVVMEDENQDLVEEIQGGMMTCKFQFPAFNESEREEEDEESKKQRGKENVEKWVQMLFDKNNTHETADVDRVGRADEIIEKLNLKYPHLDIKISSVQESKDEVEGKSNTPSRNPPYILGPEKYNQSEVDALCEETFIKEVLNPIRVWPRKSNADDSKEVGHHTETCDENERKSERGRKLTRSESGRAFRRIPSSPSLILSGMKKRMITWARRS